MIACPSCGFEARDDFAFCPRCATPLAAPPPIAEERKVVTTLFCDLVSFTAMSEAADPEDVERVLGEYFARASRAIESHGGTVEKYIGDAVVGVFGVPVVHEDDPERAVRAGLRVMGALGGLTRPDSSPLQARVGVNTGEALVRLDVDPASGRGFLAGDAVNTAARLQAAAPPSAVAVGALTRQLTEHAIVYEELPPVSAKGKAAPVRAWRAVRPLARTGLRTSGAGATPLFGREKELEALATALDDAVSSGQRRAVLVVGDPGIGKSRLVLELARSLDERPRMITWRHGRCLAYGEGVSFWALGQIVKGHAGIQDADDAEAVRAKLQAVVPEGEEGTWLRQRLGPLVGLESSQASREENFAAWARFLDLVATPRPAVVVLEDLHWAGEGMLAFVAYLLGRAASVPLLLVMTTRHDVLAGDQAGLVPTAGDDGLRRVTLAPLTGAATQALVTGLIGAAGGEDLAPRIVERAAGNPLFAEQYVRLLFDEGASDGAGERPHLDGGVELALPGTVQAVIAARLDALPPQQKALLCDAAVAGEAFWGGCLAAVSGNAPEAVDDAMAALASKGLVRHVVTPANDGEPEYVFWHALTRDVAYAQLPRKARARKHEAVAGWLEAAAGERRDELAEVLAHHRTTALELARLAGDEEWAGSLVGPAVDALRRAGERALRLDAAAAEHHFAAALELAGPYPALRLRILPGWGKTLLVRDRLREAATVYEEAVAGLAAAGDLRGQASAMSWSADVLLSLNEPAAEVLQASVDLLDDDDPSPELVEVLSHYALGLMIQDGDPRAVREACDRALEMARRLGLPEPVVALSCRGGARLALGDRAGLDDIERAVSASREQGLGVERATLELNSTSLVFAVRGVAAERAALDEVTELVRRTGIQAHVSSCRAAVVDCLVKAGEWDEALRSAAPLALECETTGDRWDLLYVRALQALVHARRGMPEEAAPILDWMEGESLRSEIGWTRDTVLVAAAAVHLSADRGDAAADVLDACFSFPRACISILEMVPEAIRTAVACGAPGLAARIARQVGAALPATLLPLEHHVVASVDAAVAETRGEYEAAASRFAAAAGGWHEFGMPYEEAQALLGAGRCLGALGRGPEAAPALVQARDIFARLGAAPGLAEAAALLAAMGATSQPGGTGRPA